jgi:hypothetical protein
MNQNTFHSSSKRQKAIRTIMAALLGGSVLTSCDTRLKQAVVGGTQQFVLGLFNPDNPDGFGSLFFPPATE